MNKKSLYISRILSSAEKTRSRGQIKPFSATTHAENRVIRKRPKLLRAILVVTAGLGFFTPLRWRS